MEVGTGYQHCYHLMKVHKVPGCVFPQQTNPCCGAVYTDTQGALRHSQEEHEGIVDRYNQDLQLASIHRQYRWLEGRARALGIVGPGPLTALATYFLERSRWSMYFDNIQYQDIHGEILDVVSTVRRVIQTDHVFPDFSVEHVHLLFCVVNDLDTEAITYEMAALLCDWRMVSILLAITPRTNEQPSITAQWESHTEFHYSLPKADCKRMYSDFGLLDVPDYHLDSVLSYMVDPASRQMQPVASVSGV
jgi:hypothetical protein